ncbi:UNKNOWN [Stylonychia lemnae]|uniref:Intermembrane lipid transfer protein VPS13-like C-terminal domain-containing protein n=1 Tax=Stylonychia lemnae TaxID=5949 RepID=A0A078AVQ6_STYLE|nr:UNKNOWN [Stylonychia lemnae]|eukprot:CDW86490.1 UNKNOWN [Stylonychia lemnae]
MKCVRILNAQNAVNQNELIRSQKDKLDKDSTQKIKLFINEIGMSIVNSQAREIAYIYITNLKFSKRQTNKNKKISFRADTTQIDNQLVRQNDAIIFKKQMRDGSKQIVLKVHIIDNQAIENLYYYKYFYLELAPFDLNVDGNFCDEFYKYTLDIFSQAKSFTQQSSFNQIGSNVYEDVEDIEKMKQTFNDLKKPYEKNEVQAQKRIFFEQFYINDVKFNFSFQSSPILFREFTMNPTLKFFIVLLISSMGLFGNLGDTAHSLKYAFGQLLQNPFQTGFKQLFKGGLGFVKHTISAIIGPIGSVFETFRRGVYFIVQSSQINEDFNNLVVDRDLFDDDISNASREINTFSSPLAIIDTQNKIWMKIISREKQNYEVKKRQLMKFRELSNQGEELQRRQNVGNLSVGLNKIYKFTAIFSNFIWSGVQLLNNQLSEEEAQTRVLKVRPPRFVSFRMELESYNLQKALALEILNDINLNVFENEMIQKVFSFKFNSFIFTGKRFICVQSRLSETSQKRHYTHWNILYKDVIKIRVQIFNRLTNEQVEEDYFIRLFEDVDRNKRELQNMYLLLKIHYHQIGDAGETGEIDKSLQKLSLENRKKNMLKRDQYGFGGLGLDLQGDLRIGVQEILATYQEDNKLRYFYIELSKRIDKKN